MLYMLRVGASQPLILGTCDNPDITEIDYAKSRGCGFYTEEEAIKLGARTRNRLGKEIWFGVNVSVKIEDHVFQVWWLGKWRPLGYYHLTNRKPSAKWVMARLENAFRLNAGLDPVTKIIYHWED